MSAVLTIVGRLTSDAELRFSASGVAVAKFTVVSSRRVKNSNTDTWEDSDVTYWDCVAFKQLAENIVSSVVKGTEVVVVGRAKQESWEDRQTGQKRSKMSVTVDHIGPSLRTVTARLEKTSGNSSGQSSSGGGWGGAQQASSQDPWASQAPAAAGASSGWGAQQGGSEPPF